MLHPLDPAMHEEQSAIFSLMNDGVSSRCCRCCCRSDHLLVVLFMHTNDNQLNYVTD